MVIRRLSILGVGLLGGSLGLAMKKSLSGCKIMGYGHRKSTLDRALQLGAIDEATTDLAQACSHADVVVLCTPVGVFEETIKSIAGSLRSGTIVTDVGSTKRSVVQVAHQHLPEGVHFVGSHPMAGSEKRGVEFARADLFNKATCILTPTPKTNPQALETVKQFWTLMGMKVVQMTPEDHDKTLADISHLPHALAAALMAMQEDDKLTHCGKGFLDTTRIASGDGGLWRDILIDNRDNLRNSIQKLKATLDHLSKLLEPESKDALKVWLDETAARREQLLAKKQCNSNPE